MSVKECCGAGVSGGQRTHTVPHPNLLAVRVQAFQGAANCMNATKEKDMWLHKIKEHSRQLSAALGRKRLPRFAWTGVGGTVGKNEGVRKRFKRWQKSSTIVEEDTNCGKGYKIL